MSDSLIVALLAVVIHQQGVYGLAHNAAVLTTLGKEFWGRGSKAYSSDEHTEMPKVYLYYAFGQQFGAFMPDYCRSIYKFCILN